MLSAAAWAAPAGSAGDSRGIRPAEFRLWPGWAMDVLAAVLAAVEAGAGWPDLRALKWSC